MKRIFTLLLTLLILPVAIWSQANFLISSPSEIKMVGNQSYHFYNRHCYLTYQYSSGSLKLFVNMNELVKTSDAPMPGQDIEYSSNLTDTNYMVFDGQVENELMQPNTDPKESFTFTSSGKLTLGSSTYMAQAVLSYGARMISNNGKLYLNINIVLSQMDLPMYIPGIKDLVDNIQVEMVDAYVNIIPN